MNLILNECGNILRDSDVRNFLKFTSKELHRIPYEFGFVQYEKHGRDHVFTFMCHTYMVSSPANSRSIIMETETNCYSVFLGLWTKNH